MRIMTRTSLMGVVLASMLTAAAANAAPPAAVLTPVAPANPAGADDKARAAREAARKLKDEAANLEKQADADRDTALATYMSALKAADAKDATAEAKKAEARKLLLVAKAYSQQEVKAEGLRIKGKNLLGQSFAASHKAATLDQQAAGENSRAKAQRDAAAALLSGNPDAQMKADAADLIKLAEGNERDAADFSKQANAERTRAKNLRDQAIAAFTEADKLDPDGSYDYNVPVPRVVRRAFSR